MKNHAFTLIELLVVILIIAVLTAIAYPQYQKAVWRSRNVQLKTLLKVVADAQQEYYLTSGEYAKSFDVLNIELPLAKRLGSPNDLSSTCPLGPRAGRTDPWREGDGYQLVLQEDGTLYIFWVEKPYTCAGFRYVPESQEVRCVERTAVTGGVGGILHQNFCSKLEKGTYKKTDGGWRIYQLP